MRSPADGETVKLKLRLVRLVVHVVAVEPEVRRDGDMLESEVPWPSACHGKWYSGQWSL